MTTERRRQFYFTPQDVDLLRAALELWDGILMDDGGGYRNSYQRGAGHFTSRRINELLNRLKDNNEGCKK